jgi:hypothetical protein
MIRFGQHSRITGNIFRKSRLAKLQALLLEESSLFYIHDIPRLGWMNARWLLGNALQTFAFLSAHLDTPWLGTEASFPSSLK